MAASINAGCASRTSCLSLTSVALILRIVAITVVAAILRFHALGAKPLWFDEGLSVGCAQLSFPGPGRDANLC